MLLDLEDQIPDRARSIISKLGYKAGEVVYAEKGYQVPANVSYFHSVEGYL
ncbi:MAG: hypothetical protein ACMUEL_00810 [Flavobacteriales bacterium Tduv]